MPQAEFGIQPQPAGYTALHTCLTWAGPRVRCNDEAQNGKLMLLSLPSRAHVAMGKD